MKRPVGNTMHCRLHDRTLMETNVWTKMSVATQSASPHLTAVPPPGQSHWPSSADACGGVPEPHERPHVLVTSPGSPERQDAHHQAPSVGGRVQLRLGFDPVALQLLVTIVCAAGLTPRPAVLGSGAGHQQQQLQHSRNPYCKLFLLPDRSERSKRRTRTLAGE